jgi:PEP-CTERM motif.
VKHHAGRGGIKRIIRLSLSLTIAALGTGLVTNGATITWENTSGGDFHEGVNWSGGVVPSDADVALFGWKSDFGASEPIAITFNADVNNLQLQIQHATHEFDLGGNTYTLTSTGNGSDASVLLGMNLQSDGSAGAATLNLVNGTVLAEATILGLEAGNSGTLTVGANAQWLGYQFLDIGFNGNGALNILDGGYVASAGAAIGGDLWSFLPKGPDSTGTVTVSGSDSLSGLNSQWDVYAGILSVGQSGTGTLQITDKGQVNVYYDVLVGQSPSANGTITIEGTGSALNIGGLLEVGSSGTGTVIIQNGGVLNALDGTIATAGGTGTVTVTNAGSELAFGNRLLVGEGGTGTITVSDRGRVSADTAFIGSFPGVSGTVEVTGQESRFDVTNLLVVGQAGNGTLNVLNGGLVTSDSGAVGGLSGSSGTVLVSGTGSKWQTTQGITVGLNGQGHLTVEDDGEVETSHLRIESNGVVDGAGGTITGPVTNRGVMHPGLGAPMTVNGNYLLTSNGAIVLDIAGPTIGDYSQLRILGDAIFNGLLIVNFINGFLPQVNDTFDLVQVLLGGTSVFTGTVNITGLNPFFQYTENFDNGYSLTITQSPVPEPAAMILVGAGLLALGCMRKRFVK